MGHKGYYASLDKLEESLDGDRPLSATSPEHYSRFNIEPIDFISANKLGFEAGNVIKYVCRYDAKAGLEDLKKARKYLDFLIAREEGRKPSEVT